MKFTACVAACLLLTLTTALVKSDYAQVRAEQTLLNYLMSPNVLAAAADPAATAACFTKFLPVLSEIGSTFSTEYQACITLAEPQIADLTAAAEGNRTSFINTTQSICTAYTNCNNDNEILSFFDCYASVSTQDVSVVYTLQTNATFAAATLSAGLKLVQQQENTCTNTTEETYVKNTAATYALLDSCLAAAGASTLAPLTVLPPSGNAVIAFALQKNCSDESGTRTQTSADGSQTQTQTGPGCKSQSSGSASQSQSQSGSGSQSQSQCSGSDCKDYKPLPPLFPIAPMEPIEPMAPMQPLN